MVDALDRLTGRKPEPLTAAADEPCPRALLKLEEPVTHADAAPQALERLVPPLVRELEHRQLGARRLALTGFRVDGSLAAASVATAIPSRHPKHLQRLLSDKAAALDPGFGFEAFALAADWAEPLDAAQASLVEEPSSEAQVARLVDRLSVKLGPGKVGGQSRSKPCARAGERVGERAAQSRADRRAASAPAASGRSSSTAPKPLPSSTPPPKASHAASCGGGRCTTLRA